MAALISDQGDSGIAAARRRRLGECGGMPSFWNVESLQFREQLVQRSCVCEDGGLFALNVEFEAPACAIARKPARLFKRQVEQSRGVAVKHVALLLCRASSGS